MAVGISRSLVWSSSSFQEALVNLFLEPAFHWIVFGGTVVWGSGSCLHIKSAEAVVSLLRDPTFISLLYFLT